MDFQSPKSDLESTEDIIPALSSTTSIEDVKIESNGSIANDDGYDLITNGNGSSEPYLDRKKLKEEAEELNSNDHENLELRPGYGYLHSPRSTSGYYVDAITLVSSGEKGTDNDLDAVDSCVSPPTAPLGSPGMSPSISGVKGKGLRKWKRIRRKFVKDGALNKDSAKMLKRSADLVNPSMGIAEMKQKSDGSESSVNEVLHNVLNTDAFPIDRSTPGYELPDGSTFSAGTGSDEDRNSRSSTAASIPKSRHDIPRSSGHSRDKQKPKPMSGKHLGNSSQRLQQGLGNVDASKKPRGETINMDKENSLSSPDSDSASYSSAFVHCPSSGINNGQSDKETGYAGDDGPTGEQQSVEKLPTGPSLSIEDEEISQGDTALSWKVRGRDKNRHISGNWDPLVDCVQMLQSTQDALEQELQKFDELGKDLWSLDDVSIRTTGAGPEFCAASSSDCPTSKEFGMEITDAMIAKLISLAKKTEIWEKQVELAKGKMNEKETKIAELQATINNLISSNEDLGRSIDVQQKKYEEIAAEVDALFKQKMEAEIQYLAVADMSVVAENRMKLLLTEQKFLASAQAQEMQKVEKLEHKAASLEAKAEVGLTSGKGTAGAEKVQKRISKFALCFFIQLILFILVFKLFISQFLPETTVVLPT